MLTVGPLACHAHDRPSAEPVLLHAFHPVSPPLHIPHRLCTAAKVRASALQRARALLFERELRPAWSAIPARQRGRFRPWWQRFKPWCGGCVSVFRKSKVLAVSYRCRSSLRSAQRLGVFDRRLVSHCDLPPICILLNTGFMLERLSYAKLLQVYTMKLCGKMSNGASCSRGIFVCSCVLVRARVSVRRQR